MGIYHHIQNIPCSYSNIYSSQSILSEVPLTMLYYHGFTKITKIFLQLKHMIYSWQHKIGFKKYWCKDLILSLTTPSGRGGNKSPQYQHHTKRIWYHHWSNISYHQEYHPVILDNKDKRWGKFSDVAFTGIRILWKLNLRGCTLHCRRIETNWKLTLGVTHSLGWWPHAHQCSEILWSSMPYHEIKWLYKFSNRTCIYCP